MIAFISSFIAFLAGVIFEHYIIPSFTSWYLWRKHRTGKHYCNHCRLAYFDGREALNVEYCGKCGRPLEHFKLEDEHPNGADVESERKDDN